MTCDEFLARHCEFVDDRLTLPDVAAMRRHMRACESCADYDRVIAEGRRALLALPDAEPSSSFYAGLRARLAEVEAESDAAPPSHREGPGALAPLSIAAVIAAVAWSALLRPEAPTVDLPAMAAKAPAPKLDGGFFSTAPRFAPANDWPAPWWSSRSSAGHGFGAAVGTRSAVGAAGGGIDVGSAASRAFSSHARLPSPLLIGSEAGGGAGGGAGFAPSSFE